MSTAATLTAAFKAWPALPCGVVIEELGILNGYGRADVAIVGDELYGFELKSRADTLVRLPEQVKTYDEVFDRCTLVADWRHLAKARPLLPNHWGIVEDGPGGLVELRRALPNKTQDPASIARLLWKAEAAELAIAFGARPGIRWWRKDSIEAALLNVVGPAALRAAVRAVLRFHGPDRKRRVREVAGAAFCAAIEAGGGR